MINLLIVDDDVIASKALKKGINWEKIGITGDVYVAHDAQEAKIILSNQNISILLADIEMPGENGLSLVHFVNQIYPDILCIFLSCHDNFSFARKAVSLNVEDYLLLPISYEKISETVERAVQKALKNRHEKQLQKYGEHWISNSKGVDLSSINKEDGNKEIANKCKDILVDRISDSSFHISDLETELFLSTDHMNRIFKKEVGVSLHQYLIQERLKLAAQLLRNTSDLIYNIAEEVGYNNYPHFISSFKKQFGVTPNSQVHNLV